MRTHKKCDWCLEEINQEDLSYSQYLKPYLIHKECDKKLTQLIKESGIKCNK
jgi:hypothetical protein